VDLDDIYEADEPDECLCGHSPIIKLCILKNTVNGNTVTVGNCCVTKFTHLPSARVFDAFKRVLKDYSKSLNPATLTMVYKQGVINEWEYRFYTDTMRKRNLSEKQMFIRKRINYKILKQRNKIKL